MSRAIRKHGKDTFSMKILHTVDRAKADECEVFAIAAYNSTVPAGYNVLPGGLNGARRNAELGNRVAISRTGESKSKDLPAYIYLMKGKKAHGYECHVPGLPRQSFSKESMTMEEKLALAQACKERLLASLGPESQRKYDLPQHIYHDKGRSGNGYRVAKPGHKKKSFTSAQLTMAEKRQLAQEYLEGLT